MAQAWGAVANAGYVTLRAAVRRLTFAESSPADTLLESWFPVLTGWGSHFPDDFTVNCLWAFLVADEAPRGQNSHDLPLFLRDLVFVWPRGPPSGAGHFVKGSPSRTPRSQRHNAQTNAPAVQTPTSTLKQSCATWHSRLAKHCTALCTVLTNGGGHWVAPRTGLALPTTWAEHTACGSARALASLRQHTLGALDRPSGLTELSRELM